MTDEKKNELLTKSAEELVKMIDEAEKDREMYKQFFYDEGAKMASLQSLISSMAGIAKMVK